jgi:hypothetical protein
MNHNYMLKVEDAKIKDIQDALKAAGITIRSIQELHKEEPRQAETTPAE